MKKILPIIMILSLFLTSCGKTVEDNGKINVYTSFYAMYDFARTIGGDDINLTNIVPTGTEPHDFEPTAADMAKLSKADVFIYNGAGMDDWAESVAENIGTEVNTECTSQKLDVDGSDPHVWLSIYNAEIQLESICKAITNADTQNAEKYMSRLQEYLLELHKLTDEYKNVGLDGKKIFVTHGAYGYLCKDFGMEQIALEGIYGESDPSPAQMAKIIDEIKAEGAKCIFYDPLEKSKIADAVASEAGIQTAPLYTFEGDSQNRDYLTIMKLNLEQLKKGL